MATPYAVQTWVDASGANPVSAARMTVIETGIFDSHYRPRGAINATVLSALSSGVQIEVGVSAGWNGIAFTEEYDSEGWHPGSGMNPGSVRIGVAGTYLFTAYCNFAASTGSGRYVGVMKNGSAPEAMRSADAGASIPVELITSTVMKCAVADRLGMTLYQTSGVNNTPAAIRFTWTLLSY